MPLSRLFRLQVNLIPLAGGKINSLLFRVENPALRPEPFTKLFGVFNLFLGCSIHKIQLIRHGPDITIFPVGKTDHMQTKAFFAAGGNVCRLLLAGQGGGGRGAGRFGRNLFAQLCHDLTLFFVGIFITWLGDVFLVIARPCRLLAGQGGGDLAL